VTEDHRAAGNPRVVVLGLGGTIAMTASGGGAGVTPRLTAEELVAAVPGLAGSGIDVEVVDLLQIPGASLTIDDVLEVSRVVAEKLDDGVDGIVVTQGTDTIEESAYVLDLAHQGPQPVVVTGAMRNPTLAGADGPANILAAVQVAGSPRARDLGVLVVFADEIHAADRVHKSHSTHLSPFRSANGGPLGFVVEGEVHIANRRVRSLRVPAVANPEPVAVGLVTMALGDDGALLGAAGELFDGVVIAALGGGHVPARTVPKIDELLEKMPVVLASRTGGGRVLSRTYAFPGSESDLLARGAISAGYLDPSKARLLLHHLLRAGCSADRIAEAFALAGNPAGAPPATSRPAR
jgi:L-asparaginase